MNTDFAMTSSHSIAFSIKQALWIFAVANLTLNWTVKIEKRAHYTLSA